MSIPFQSSREEYPAALEAFGDWNCPGFGVREAFSQGGSFSQSHQLFFLQTGSRGNLRLRRKVAL